MLGRTDTLHVARVELCLHQTLIHMQVKWNHFIVYFNCFSYLSTDYHHNDGTNGFNS